MPGAKLDGASVYELLNDFKVTCTGAVPTVWLLLLQYLEKTGGKLPYLNRVIIGGSACPRAMIKTFEQDYGVHVFHAWGMTEMSPLGTVGSLKPEYADLPLDGQLDIKQKQGHTPFGVEMKITDDAGQEAALGRQDIRPHQGARASPSPRPITTTTRRYSTATAISTPATSARSTRTATCRSPTAPRT